MLRMEKVPLFGTPSMESLWFHYPHEITFGERLQVTVSCNFQFGEFPFDDHLCDFDFGDPIMTADCLQLETTEIFYNNVVANQDHVMKILLDGSRLPFECQVCPKLAYLQDRVSRIDANSTWQFSYTGMHIYMKRDKLGKLLTGYFMLTGIFSFLSAFSFTISPDVVS